MPSSTAFCGDTRFVKSAGDGSYANSFSSPCAHLPQYRGLFGVLDKFPIDYPLTIGGRSCRVSASFALLPPAGFQTFDDQSALKLGSSSHDLPHESTHWVVVVIGEVFASVCGKHALSVRPYHRQNCFLLSEMAGKTIEVGCEQSVDLPLSQYLQRFGKPGPFVIAGFAGDCFIPANFHDAHVVGAGVVTAVPLLDVEAVTL